MLTAHSIALLIFVDIASAFVKITLLFQGVCISVIGALGFLGNSLAIAILILVGNKLDFLFSIP
jgi:hypothetical protein